MDRITPLIYATDIRSTLAPSTRWKVKTEILFDLVLRTVSEHCWIQNKHRPGMGQNR